MRFSLLISLFLFSLTTLDAEPIPVKVVIVSMYEIGEDTGDRPGELQHWVEGNELKKISNPLGWRDLYLREDGMLITCTGGGVTNATSSILALALDRRFDLSQAYWIVAGIAGVDPVDCSLGSAVWANWVIDGDLALEIDGREIPEDWPYGYIALGAKKPNTLDDGWQVDTVKFKLNTKLVQWAYGLTKDIELPEHPECRAFGELFTEAPAASQPPKVMIGDTMGSSTYWHGFHFNDWANDWVKLHTGGEGNYVTTNMEDNGTVTALSRAAKTGHVGFDRILILRTASNFSRPPAGKDVAWSLNAPYPAGGLPALEAAYNVASVVANELITNWDKHGETIPTP